MTVSAPETEWWYQCQWQCQSLRDSDCPSINKLKLPAHGQVQHRGSGMPSGMTWSHCHGLDFGDNVVVILTSHTSPGSTSRRLTTKIHNLPQLTARRHRLHRMFAELTHKLAEFDFKTTYHKNPQLITIYRQKAPIAQCVRRIDAQREAEPWQPYDSQPDGYAAS